MQLPALNGQKLIDFLGLEKVAFGDERRKGYQNLYDIWYARTHNGLRPPYMYDINGEWLETPTTARQTAIAHVILEVFDEFPDYKRELMRAALDKSLSDDDFVLEMAKLNNRFVHQLDDLTPVNALRVKGHDACHHNGKLTCPNCDAAANSLYVAGNAAQVYDDLLHMDQAERWQALDNLALRNSVKEFRAAAAKAIAKREGGGFVILTDQLLTRTHTA